MSIHTWGPANLSLLFHGQHTFTTASMLARFSISNETICAHTKRLQQLAFSLLQGMFSMAQWVRCSWTLIYVDISPSIPRRIPHNHHPPRVLNTAQLSVDCFQYMISSRLLHHANHGHLLARALDLLSPHRILQNFVQISGCMTQKKLASCSSNNECFSYPVWEIEVLITNAFQAKSWNRAGSQEEVCDSCSKEVWKISLF